MSAGMESAASPFAAEVLRRLPLAEAFHTAWGYIAADPVLDDLFGRHRGRCDQDHLTFAEWVRVLALTRGRGAIPDAAARNRISCRVRAVSGKSARLPLPLAGAFLTALTRRPRPLFPATARPPALPARLDGLSVVAVDGTKVERVAERPLPTRNQPGTLYGGKRPVAHSPAEGVAVGLAADVDGEASDIRSVPHLLPTVREVVTGPRPWGADRQFCDLIPPRRFAAGDDHFAVRYGRNTSSHPDPTRAVRRWHRRGRSGGPPGVGVARGGEPGRAAAVRAAGHAGAAGGRGRRHRPDGRRPDAAANRGRVPTGHRGVPPATAGRRPPAADGVPGVPVPGPVRRAATGAGAIAAGRPEPTPDAVSGEQVFADRTKELTG